MISQSDQSPVRFATRATVSSKTRFHPGISAEMTSGQCGVVWPLGSLPDVVGHSLLRGSIEGG